MDRLSRLRAGREIPQVVLQKYNQLRSRNPGVLVCAFEGFDDLTFYDATFKRINFDIKFLPLICKGKDQVLNLRMLLSRNIAKDAACVRYFVDQDFDGLKGQITSDDVYCTPCYSIENLLVCPEILEGLLRSEFRCNDEFGVDDIRRITQLFELRLSELFQAMDQTNKLIFFARRSMIELSSIENDISKYVKINLQQVVPIANSSDQAKLVGYATEPTPEELSSCDAAFEQLKPKDDWRGKFIYAFFKKFLSELKEDRGQKSPEFFSARAKMTFAPASDMVRTLVALMPMPECLTDFVRGLPGT